VIGNGDGALMGSPSYGQVLKLVDEDRLDAAEAAADRLDARGPEDEIDKLLLIVHVQGVAGRTEAKLATIERLIARHPDFPDGYYLLSTTLLQLGQPREALSAADRAIALAPDYTDGLAARVAARTALSRQLQQRDA
jgi:tetratricopeptide (TPR) repeat protein